MMTLLFGLHSIAAQRGDGLRSEFLERMARPGAQVDSDRNFRTGESGEVAANREPDVPTNEIIRFPHRSS